MGNRLDARLDVAPQLYKGYTTFAKKMVTSPGALTLLNVCSAQTPETKHQSRASGGKPLCAALTPYIPTRMMCIASWAHAASASDLPVCVVRGAGP